MTVFIGIAILACISGLYVKLWGRRFEEVLPLSMFSIIFIIYFTGVMGSLKAGFLVVTAAAGFCGAACLFWAGRELFVFRRERKIPDGFLRRVLTPGCAAFLALAVFFWWLNRGRLLMQWDDFSHWGLAVKNMHIFQQLGNIPESTVKFLDYPPAASIFAYFFSNFGNYNETNAIYGMGILTMGMLFPMFRDIRWEDRKTLVSGLVLLALIFVLPTSLHKNAYIGLYVDSLLGVLFFLLVYLMCTYEAGAFRTVHMAAVCAALPRTKASGSGLAALAVFLVLAAQLPVCGKKQERRRLAIDGMICLASLALAKQSWNLYLRLSGTAKAWSASEISLQGIWELFSGRAPEYRMQTVQNYWKFFLTEPMGGWLVPFSTTVWLLLFAAFAVLFVLLCQKEDRKRYGAVFAGLIAGFVAYLLFLLVLYLFSYSEFEAVKLASADRYLNTYLVGMLCCYVGLYGHYFRKRPLLVHGIAALCLTLCVTKTGIGDVLLYPKESILTSQMLEEGYRGALRFQNKLDYVKDRVYVISQNNYGLDYWVLRNIFTPVKINDNYTWSIGEPYNASDVFTTYKNIYSWSEDLKQFDYVYLFRVDDAFREQFGELFDNPQDIQNDTMFTVSFDEKEELAHLTLNQEMTSYGP